jgi:uncharacterized protein
MKSRIHVITLGVENLERSLQFYRDLGLDSNGIVGTEFLGDDTHPAGAAAQFQLDGGIFLMLYPRRDLAKDASVPVASMTPGTFSIGHAVARRDDVDTVLASAQAAGATLTEEPHERPWGIYSGYFRDLDGHLWEVLWNPALEDV